MKYKIEKGVPIKGLSKTGGLYGIIMSMKIGDSILLHINERSSASSMAAYMKRNNKIPNYTIKKVSEENCRIWIIEKKTR